MPKTLKLECCGHEYEVVIDEGALLRGEPNEVRQNVVCPQCNKIVILEFHPPRIIQEVLD